MEASRQDGHQLLPGRTARGCGAPAILNTDQSSQYQSKSWKDALDSYGIIPSMDGRGRWSDNVILREALEDAEVRVAVR